LVLVGGIPWDPSGRDPVADLLASVPPEIRRRIVLTGYVSDATKAALLGGAEALAYPSLYEGFGLPVLEAMAIGTPVLASNVSALPELVGDAGLLVDPTDAAAIAAGLESLLSDPDLRARLSARGRVRAGEFTWDVTARRTSEVLRAAAVATAGI
jgi:glycosyltransferase involved in cell wall biosynthesis